VGSGGGGVVLVDAAGRALGLADKIEAHRGDGLLHRALACLLFDDRRRLLFGRRALGKLLWPGYWDATVATHQFADETDLDAARRRVAEELGAGVGDLIAPAAIVYHAPYNAYWSEREHGRLLLGRLVAPPSPVPGEVDDLDWVPFERVAAFAATAPVTPWFRLAWEKLTQDHAAEIANWLG